MIGYTHITPETARDMMRDPAAIVIDVREPEEFAAGHVPGAQLLPLGTIGEAAAAALIPEKGTVLLVYCRSGVRSKKGAEKLAELGYTKIYEFGGILQWPYETEK